MNEARLSVLYMVKGLDFNHCEVYYANLYGVQRVLKIAMPLEKFMKLLSLSLLHSIAGSQAIIADQFGYTKKIPVYLSVGRILLFPTHAKEDQCGCWLNYYCIQKIQADNGNSLVTFSIHAKGEAKCQVVVEMSRRSLVNQMKRCKEITLTFDEDYVSWDQLFMHH